MGNEQLRQALQSAGITQEQLAATVEVDARTVRRWIKGILPRPRQRARIARALNLDQAQLFPQLNAADAGTDRATAGETITAYTTPADPAAPDWKALMRDASDRIELLGETLTPTLTTPDVPELLAAKARSGCDVRILVYLPRRHLERYVDQPGIQLRLVDHPVHYTLHRYDEQLLLVLPLGGEDPDEATLLHVRRATAGGLFDRFAEHYNELWTHESQLLDPDRDIEDDDDGDEDPEEEAEEDLPASRPPTTGVNQPLAPARRWPRRPPTLG